MGVRGPNDGCGWDKSTGIAASPLTRTLDSNARYANQHKKLIRMDELFMVDYRISNWNQIKREIIAWREVIDGAQLTSTTS